MEMSVRVTQREILYSELMNMSYKEIVRCCSDNVEAKAVCEGGDFWMNKLDYDLMANLVDRVLIPSKYVMNYPHPDSSEGEIYKRWRMDSMSIEELAKGMYVDLFIYKLDRGDNIDFDMCIDFAIQYGIMQVLDWFYDEKHIRREDVYITRAVKFDRLDVLNWAKTRGMILTVRDANEISGMGKLEILKWLANRGIYPTSKGAKDAMINNHKTTLRWLEGKGIYPPRSEAPKAAPWELTSKYLDDDLL